MGVRSGTKLPDGTVVTRGDVRTLGKLRCLHCHGTAVSFIRPDGKKVFKCENCGREYTSSKF